MKVILLLAGLGSRFYPITKSTPKPMLIVAGRPVIDQLLELLDPLEIDELILVTGHLRHQIEEHVKKFYKGQVRSIEQKEFNGTGGAVFLAREFIDSPVLILYADTLFDTDLTDLEIEEDGIIWTEKVEDYWRFGIVKADENGHLLELIEKSEEFVGDLANIGLFYIRDWKTMFECLEEVMNEEAEKGEWYLTYAFRKMAARGKKLAIRRVKKWLDCGKLSALLDANRFYLTKSSVEIPELSESAVVRKPVCIDPTAKISNSVIGPNVVIGPGCTIEGSMIVDSIVGQGCNIFNSNIYESMIDDFETTTEAFFEKVLVSQGDIVKAP